jgi:hypothetical protein
METPFEVLRGANSVERAIARYADPRMNVGKN